MGPTSKEKEKKIKDKNLKKQMKDGQKAFEFFFSFHFFLLLVLFQIPEFLTVRIRRDKHEKCSTRRGLRVSTRNTRFHREFR